MCDHNYAIHSDNNQAEALRKWHEKLTRLSQQHLQNVLDFLSFCEATEIEFDQRRQQEEEQQLIQLEALLSQIAQDENYDTNVQRSLISRIRHAEQCQRENHRKVHVYSGKISGSESREAKLQALVKKLQDLTTELEQALENKDDFSNNEEVTPVCIVNNSENDGLSQCEGAESEDDDDAAEEDEVSESSDCNEIEESLQQATEELEKYCEHRKNAAEDGKCRMNYLRFQRTSSEPLNTFLRVIENELLRLWVREDRTRWSHELEHRSVTAQTEATMNNCTFRDASTSTERETEASETLTECSTDCRTLERPGKPIITVEPFSLNEANRKPRAEISLYSAPLLPLPPVDSTPHLLCNGRDEITKFLKGQQSVTGFSSHHYYATRLQEITQYFNNKGYDLYEQFHTHKYVSEITAVPRGLCTRSVPPAGTVVGTGYGSTKLEATERAVHNVCASSIVDGDRSVINDRKEDVTGVGRNVINSILGGSGDGHHLIDDL